MYSHPQKQKESEDLAVSEPPPVRKFQENWKKDGKCAERLWLLYENGNMFCASCRFFFDDKNNIAPFVVGTNKFKLKYVKSHEVCKFHAWTSKSWENEINKTPASETEAGKALVQLTGPRQENYFVDEDWPCSCV